MREGSKSKRVSGEESRRSGGDVVDTNTAFLDWTGLDWTGHCVLRCRCRWFAWKLDVEVKREKK